MNNLSIAVDMGAKNNGVFICKSSGDKILRKKATNIIIDNINFSKKSRRENRHKDRNYKRRKLAKRLLKEVIDFSKYNEKQQELILGLLNNRGYTFISTSTEFEKLNDETVKFINEYFEELSELITKEDFENKISEFENLDELKSYINTVNEKIQIETKKKKAQFYKEFQASFSNFIKNDLKTIRDLFSNILKELDTGSKPRKKYLDEIKLEIQNDFDFIENFSKDEFYNLIGNISNLQLRVLRKYFNQKFNDELDLKKLDSKIRRYFKAFHYKSEKEKLQRVELFSILDNEQNILNLLKNTNPELTIPPYEDMNNRNTYKCNSILIKPELIDENLKECIDILLKNEYFSNLTINANGEFKIEELIKTKPSSNNAYIDTDFTYSKYLQRILDIKIDEDNKAYHPREVFKKQDKKAIELFKKLFGEKIYETLKDVAQKYYIEEEKILNGIYEESTSILTKCNTNTPYKNNAKHILLKPIYSYNFTNDEADSFIKSIEDTYGLKSSLQRVSEEAKKYQNSFYHIVEACYKNDKCIDDKEIKTIVKNLDKNFSDLKFILKDKNTYLNSIEKVDENNLSRVINILKQTYEILFKELGGFNKTCKCCTIENSIRSDENNVIAKRLLSDVAKPIDGMLDMMLDRLAFEIIQNIDENDIKDIENLEILLEQNKFEFEENLNTIKRANNPQIKKFDKDKFKDKLNVKVCPYTGKAFEKGDWDHILPQSKGVYNSKANMIYASVEGNQKVKGNKEWTLEDIYINSPKHLEEVFGKKSLEEIKEIIKLGINSIKIENFTNFNNLKLQEQIALRYALFMKGTEEFKKAFEIVKKDKIKTFSNGTQKRLARFIYEKLVNKFPNETKNIVINSKVIDNQLVSNTRKYLAVDKETGEINHLFKEEKQKSHSHCIDAMVVFYLANSKVKGAKHRQSEYVSQLEPQFNFEDIYVDEKKSNEKFIKKDSIKNRLAKNKEINSIASTEVLFRENGVSVHYLNIFKKDEKYFYGESKKTIQEFKNFNSKLLNFFKALNLLIEFDKSSFCVKVNELNNFLFEHKNEVLENISKFKKIDELRYTTQKKGIIGLLNGFLNPSSNDEKKFMENLIGIKKPDKIEYFTKENLIAFFQKGSKTSHKQITLKIDKTWSILAQYLSDNKEEFLTQSISEEKSKLNINLSKLKEVLSKSILFRKTHKTKRKITNEFSLPLKDVTDRMFILRRKNHKKEYIYQYVLANRDNSTRSFFENQFIHKYKNGDFHQNIIPSDITFYHKAFKKNEN